MAVDSDEVPAEIGAGDSVDVYIRPSTRAACPAASGCDGRPVVAGATVVDTRRASDALGSGDTRSLVLALTPAQTRRYFARLAATDDPTLTLVGRG